MSFEEILSEIASNSEAKRIQGDLGALEVLNPVPGTSFWQFLLNW